MASKLVSYINENISFADEWLRIFGRPISPSKEFCPWHHNVNTPAGKYYQDRNRFHCFGECQRSYGTYDLLKKFDPQRIDEIKTTVILPDLPQPIKERPKVQCVTEGKTLKQILDSLCLS